MKRHLLSFAVAIGAVCSPPSAQSAPRPLSPRAALQADYNAIYADARRKDAQGAMHYFARDFIGEDRASTPANRNPPMDWAQLRDFATGFAGTSSRLSRGQAVITALSVKGDEATVTVRHHGIVTGIVDGRHLVVVFDAVTKDTWVHGPHGWLMQHGRALSARVQRHES